ncbi:hypothetical protein IWW46_005953, partial [Coemansia sp. RSA 2440]
MQKSELAPELPEISHAEESTSNTTNADIDELEHMFDAMSLNAIEAPTTDAAIMR